VMRFADERTRRQMLLSLFNEQQIGDSGVGERGVTR
jgi:hypothetical protein